jgi:hypothetical protein
MPTKTIYKTLPSAVSYVTQGTYQREIVGLTAQAWTTGTEFELGTVSDNIVADTADRDELFSWVRLQVALWIGSAYNIYEWMVLRMDSADALPNLNDSATVEGLQKDKRILSRGLEWNPNITYGRPRVVKVELYNVKLRYGEEIRFVVRPLVTTAASGEVQGLLEWRQVGV